jgi:hypothetical protein
MDGLSGKLGAPQPDVGASTVTVYRVELRFALWMPVWCGLPSGRWPESSGLFWSPGRFGCRSGKSMSRVGLRQSSEGAVPAAATVHALPADIASFTGRSSHLERVLQALPDRLVAGGVVRIDAIDGMAQVPDRDGDGKGELIALITTITDPRAAPAPLLARAYHERWEHETGNDQLKTHLRGPGRVLRSKSPDMVRQEIYGFLLAHHAMSALICRAATEADIDPDRVKFTRTVRIIRRAIGLADFPP